ncbi:hypothetical protein VTN02DRAFT_3107 [Thermoascus thermophilus]
MAELGQRAHEDAVRVGQHAEQRLARVAETVDHEQLAAGHGDRPRAQHVPHVVVEALERRAHADVRRHEGGEVDGLQPVQPSARVEQAQGVARDEAAQRVSHHAQLRDAVSARGQLLQRLLDLVRDALAAQLDAVVREAAGIAFDGQDDQTLLAVTFAQGRRQIVEVVRIPPQSVVESARDVLGWRVVREEKKHSPVDEHAEVVSLGLLVFVWRDYVDLHGLVEEGFPVEARQGDGAEGRRGGCFFLLSPRLVWRPEPAGTVVLFSFFFLFFLSLSLAQLSVAGLRGSWISLSASGLQGSATTAVRLVTVLSRSNKKPGQFWGSRSTGLSIYGRKRENKRKGPVGRASARPFYIYRAFPRGSAASSRYLSQTGTVSGARLPGEAKFFFLLLLSFRLAAPKLHIISLSAQERDWPVRVGGKKRAESPWSRKSEWVSRRYPRLAASSGWAARALDSRDRDGDRPGQQGKRASPTSEALGGHPSEPLLLSRPRLVRYPRSDLMSLIVRSVAPHQPCTA